MTARHGFRARAKHWLGAAARHPARVALGGAVALGALELGYIGLAPERIQSHLREAGSTSGIDVAIEEATSWYPGDLALEGVVVESADCRARFREVDGSFSVSAWLAGEGRLRDLTVHGIDLECEADDRPRLELTGEQSELSLERLRERAGRVEFGAARLDLEGARLRVGPRAAIHDVQGEISVSGQRGEAGPFGGASIRAKLSSHRARAPLPSRAAARVVPADARGILEADVSWDEGRLDPSSRARFELPSVDYKLRSGQTARLPGGLVVSLAVDEASEKRLWRLSVPRYERGSGAYAARLRDVRATLETPISGAFDPVADGARLLASVGQARIGMGDVVLEAHFELDAPLASGSNHRSVELSGGKLEFDDLFVERGGGDARHGPSSGNLALEHAKLDVRTGFEFAGDLTARGADAQTVLELAATPAGPEWISDKFAGHPFSVAARVGYGATGLSLRDIDLERGAMTLRGWVRLDDGSRHGVLQLDYGFLSVGMRLEGDSTRIIPSPGPDWLRSLRPPCRGHARDSCETSIDVSQAGRP